MRTFFNQAKNFHRLLEPRTWHRQVLLNQSRILSLEKDKVLDFSVKLLEQVIRIADKIMVLNDF